MNGVLCGYRKQRLRPLSALLKHPTAGQVMIDYVGLDEMSVDLDAKRLALHFRHRSRAEAACPALSCRVLHMNLTFGASRQPRTYKAIVP